MASNAPHIRIGTCGSDLAMWQAHHVRDLLQAQGATVEAVVLKTRGDQIQNVSFDKMEGKGFFTKKSNRPFSTATSTSPCTATRTSKRPRQPGSSSPPCPHAGPSKTWCWCARISGPHHALPCRRGGVVGTSSMRRKNQLELGNRPAHRRVARQRAHPHPKTARRTVRRHHARPRGVHRLELDL